MNLLAKQIFDLEDLFKAVQLNAVFEDGKTFVDCIPKFSLDIVEKKYIEQQPTTVLALRNFVLENFELPPFYNSSYQSNRNQPVTEHINNLWDVLSRNPDQQESSLLNLPFRYIVPGGRFREIYYWDSYFTMLGLKEHGRYDLIESMIDNFAYLIKTYGHIPNGNRSYYLSRSQPPFFALMVTLLAEIKEEEATYLKYCEALVAEYEFWQKDSGEMPAGAAILRVVKMPGGEKLNRYFDNNPSPRQESYNEDVHVGKTSERPPGEVYTHLRAGAESGWDFSSRWLEDGKSLAAIRTTDIVPVDLNCLLFVLEVTIAKAFAISKENEHAARFADYAFKRKNAIRKYCWNEQACFFCDYDFVNKKQLQQITAAGIYPLFVKIATPPQAKQVAQKTKELLLKSGGIVTTTVNTGQQWDAPNGWAPLQWIAFAGLDNFQQNELANELAQRWCSVVEKVFEETGKLMEKYNVEELGIPAGGGEYTAQDGFGWTNGVYLALKQQLQTQSV